MPYKLIVFLLPAVMLLLVILASILPWLLSRSHKGQMEERRKREEEEERRRAHEASLAIVRSISSNDKPCNLEEVFSILEEYKP